MQIHIEKTANELAACFASFFAEKVAASPILNVALSGGRTPQIIFDTLAGTFGDQIEWSKVMFYFGDERCVPPDDVQSNYKLAHTHLFSKIKIPEQNIHRIYGEDDPEQERSRYATLLMSRLSEKCERSGDVPRFDLIMLGMGDDGHVASIFPNQLELWNSDRICEVATHPDSGQQRITITGDVINAAAEVALLVAGENKSERVCNVIEQPDVYNYLPATKVAPVDGSIRWFLDEPAASRLSSK